MFDYVLDMPPYTITIFLFDLSTLKLMTFWLFDFFSD